MAGARVSLRAGHPSPMLSLGGISNARCMRAGTLGELGITAAGGDNVSEKRNHFDN
jgi:hypothetical protein